MAAVFSQCLHCLGPVFVQGERYCGDCVSAGKDETLMLPVYTPEQLALLDLPPSVESVKAELDADQARLGVDPAGNPPMIWSTAVPMDDGAVRDADGAVPGFYRHYDAISVQSDYGRATIALNADEMDRKQIAWEVARESPVTGTVVFRLVDGQVVAQLVSYVAFA